MTFFGHEGANTGKKLFALITLITTTSLTSLNANAAAATGFGVSDAATSETIMAQGQLMPPPGSTTPATVSPFVPRAESAFYPGNMTIKGTNTSFRVRPDLSLEVTRRVNVTITPRLENTKLGHIPEGWYLLRFVVLLPNEKYFARENAGLNPYMSAEERFVTRADILAEYKNGQFAQTFNFVLPDITRGNVRCDIYTKIVAIDQKSISSVNGRVNPFATTAIKRIKTKLVPLVTVGQFIPLSDNNEPSPAVPNPLKPDPIAQHLDEYIQTIENQNKGNDLDAGPIVDEKTFAADPHLGNLHLIDWSAKDTTDFTPALRVYKAQASTDQLRYMLQLQQSYVQPMPDQLDPYFARAICLDIARLQGVSFSQVQDWFMRCRNYPYYYLNIQKNVHVTSLDTWTTKATPYHNFTAQMVANFSYNQGKSTDLYFSIGVNPSSLFPITGIGDTLKLSPLSFSGSMGTGISNSVVKSGIAQTFKSFLVSQYIADIPLQRYKVCLAISINETYYRLPTRVRGLYICDRPVSDHPITFEEGYYFGAESTLGDNSFSPQAVNILFRGDRDINEFLTHSSDYAQILNKAPMRVGAAFANAESIYRGMHLGSVPGIISLPMAPNSQIAWEKSPGPSQPMSFREAISQIGN